jgi:hypothetical protein
MTVARSKAIRVPEGVCLQCFNSQQRFAFPFLVYCAHYECLALVHSAVENATFACTPAQLPGVIAKLEHAQEPTHALPPAGDRLRRDARD